MRVPDDMTECVCFLCVERTEGGQQSFRYIGTGFFLSVPSDPPVDAHYQYLVTAKHCVERGKSVGDLYIRLNDRQGEAQFIRITDEWIYPEDEASDVAVLPFAPGADTFAYKTLPPEFLATDAIIREMAIGIGDVLYICGLFTQRHGTQRNLPIVRTGIIAAMPDEPLEDVETGLDYHAYLAEVRSIGGLSGSPVFVALEPGRVPNPHGFLRRQIWLLGLIRGHWDYKASALIDFATEELAAVNMGIAIVTPIQEVQKILFHEDAIMERKQADRERRKKNAPTLDSSLPSGESVEAFTKQDFENALKKVSQRIEKPDQET